MPKKRANDCECEKCKYGLKKAHAIWRENMFATYGWKGETFNSRDLPYGVRYQTEGICTKYPGAFDLQIVYPLGNMAHALCVNYVEQHLEKGHFVRPGERSDKIVRDFGVEFALVCGYPKVLRMVLADKNNVTEFGKMQEKYARQWEGAVISLRRD